MTDLLVEAIRAAVRAELADALAPLMAAVERAQPQTLVTVAQAAEHAHVSKCTLRRWEHDGLVRSMRRGGRVLIDLASLSPADDDEIARRAREARTP